MINIAKKDIENIIKEVVGLECEMTDDEVQLFNTQATNLEVFHSHVSVEEFDQFVVDFCNEVQTG